VRKRAFAVCSRLLESGVKLIVVACNTASAAAIAELREFFPVPFVGMVPGVKPAAGASRSGRIVILATPGTLDGELYTRVVEEFGSGAGIVNVPGHGLAELVERGEACTPRARAVVRAALGDEVGKGADTVVLGCTHYCFLADVISAEFPGVTLIDTSEAVARRAVQVLAEEGLEAPLEQVGGLNVIVTGDRGAFRGAMEKLGFAPADERVEAFS